MLSKLSNHIFWDVNKEDVNPEDHACWLIERVVTHGTLDDWKLI